jgi:hypothetical protein
MANKGAKHRTTIAIKIEFGTSHVPIFQTQSTEASSRTGVGVVDLDLVLAALIK